MNSRRVGNILADHTIRLVLHRDNEHLASGRAADYDPGLPWGWDAEGTEATSRAIRVEEPDVRYVLDVEQLVECGVRLGLHDVNGEV